MDNVNRHRIYCQSVRVKMDFKHPYSSPSCNSVIQQQLTKDVHHFPLKVAMHLSSGHLNWILTSQDRAVKSPHHLLLWEHTSQTFENWLALSPEGSSEGADSTVSNQSGSDTLLRPTNSKDKAGLSCNLPLARQTVMTKKLPFHQENITWLERGDWKAPRTKDYCSWWEKTC